MLPPLTSVLEILHYLLVNKLIDGNIMTVTGNTLGENLDRWVHKYGELSMSSQDVIRPLEQPIKATGHLRILKGNLAPGGAVAKITGKEGLGFTGKARVFNSEADMVKAVETGSIKKGEKTVVILRYLGPKGGPGESFRSSLSPTTLIVFERYAGDAQTHKSDHGRGSGSRCGVSDRWTVQWRVSQLSSSA